MKQLPHRFAEPLDRGNITNSPYLGGAEERGGGTTRKGGWRGSRGFTLVELIVVITILTILGTIAFVQIGGFAGSARDGTRISDMTNISKGLDIYRIRTGSYPTPSIPSWASVLTTMSYSGSLIFSQWVIGDSVIAAIGSMGSRMSKKPMDPLRTTTEYVYSVSANTSEYQIKTDWEGDSVALTLMDQASASSGNPTLTYIKGNYNGVVARTSRSSSPIYFLGLPSIITSATGTLTHTGISNKILIHGETNSGGISYDTTVANFLVYSSGVLPSTDAERILFASGIARAYSGTSLASKVAIKPFVDALATNNTGSLASLGGGLIASGGGSSGGNSGGSGGGSTPTTPAVCGTANGSTGSTTPSTTPASNVCSVGTLSWSVTGSGPWNWTCNSTDGGNSVNCTQYSNLVNGACTGLPANAVYYGGATSYSLVNASAGTSLVASGVSTPVANTCQFSYSYAWCLTTTVRTNNTQSILDLPAWTWACFISNDGWVYSLKIKNQIPRTTGVTGVTGWDSWNYIDQVYTRNPTWTWRETTSVDDNHSVGRSPNAWNFYTDGGWYWAGAYWLFSDGSCTGNISSLVYSYQIWSGNNCSDGTTTLFWANSAKHYINELRY